MYYHFSPKANRLFFDCLARVAGVLWVILAYAALVAVLVLILGTAPAAASTGSGTAFDAPLSVLRDVIQGPVAYTASLLGILVCGLGLVFGGEISDFVKKLMILILVISLVAFAAQVLSDLFGIGGATIDRLLPDGA